MGATEPGEDELEVVTLMEKAKFYTSLCLGTTAIVSVFAFLFLIPFVVDPAISTILSDYESTPVTCVPVEHVYAEGLRNCSWASCREGCTTAAIRCHQILVNYTRVPFHEWKAKNMTIQDAVWDVNETRFFINTEGCGYPPKVNCSEFAKRFGYNQLFKPFPCYYSKTYPEMVVERYSWDDNLRHLIISLIVPNVLFGISIGVLSYWYCPSCNRACNREKFPIKDGYIMVTTKTRLSKSKENIYKSHIDGAFVRKKRKEDGMNQSELLCCSDNEEEEDYYEEEEY